jgi:tetratricopeptide (TPR) repeat protein
VIAPRLLCATAPTTPLPATPPPRSLGASRELVAIARIELARVLWLAEVHAGGGAERASSIRWTSTRRTSIRWAALRLLVARGAAVSERAWLRRARRVLQLLDELDASRALPRVDWPGRGSLARAVEAGAMPTRAGGGAESPRDRVEGALAVLLACDCAEGRVLLADAQLEAGDLRAALESCRALLRWSDADWPAPLRQQAWRALADAHEACGNDRLALAACAEALRCGDRSAWPAQHGLVLALATADAAQVRVCARALAAADAASQREDLESLRERVRRLRGPLPWRPPFAWRSAFECAPTASASRRAHASALARVEEVCAALEQR